MKIELDDLSRTPVRQLVAEHLADMYATSPPESVHALDLSGLRDPAVTFWTLWDAGTVLGCAALRELSPTSGEIKSMRTAVSARGRGVASRLVSHLLAEAAQRGYRQLYLETGSQDFFDSARRLYEGNGFVECGPFGDYRADSNSRYYTLYLAQ